AQQFADGLALHLVSHVKRVDINHLTAVAGDFGLRNLRDFLFRGFDLVHGANHTQIKIPYAKSKVERADVKSLNGEGVCDRENESLGVTAPPLPPWSRYIVTLSVKWDRNWDRTRYKAVTKPLQSRYNLGQANHATLEKIPVV